MRTEALPSFVTDNRLWLQKRLQAEQAEFPAEAKLLVSAKRRQRVVLEEWSTADKPAGGGRQILAQCDSTGS
jgi:hypothetical protein